MADGNGFLRELTETKERAAAWVIRLLLMLFLGLASFFGNRLFDSIKELKDEMKEESRAHWQSIEKLNTTQGAMQTTQGVLQESVTELHRSIQDHEARLRSLERPGLSWPH